MQAKAAGPLLVDSTMVDVDVAIAVVVVVVQITLRTHFDANSKHCTSKTGALTSVRFLATH